MIIVKYNEGSARVSAPTYRPRGGSPVVLSAQNAATHELVNILLDIVEEKTYELSFDLTDVLQPGQYSYTLTAITYNYLKTLTGDYLCTSAGNRIILPVTQEVVDEGQKIGRGVMQVGLVPAELHIYENTVTVTAYEQTT